MRLFFGILLLPAFLSAQLSNYSVFSIPEGLTNGANAVVRLDQMKVTISAIDEMQVRAVRVVTVLNEQGDEFVNTYAHYDNETKIEQISAVVYDSFGNELEKFKSRDFLDHSASGSGTLYSDSRVKYLQYTPVSYPYTVFFEKQYVTSDTAFIPNWYFMDGYEVSTETSSYSLDVLSNSPIRVDENNLEKFGVTSENTNTSLRYKATNIKAVKKEPFSPGYRDLAPNVKVALNAFSLKGVNGKAITWEEYGRWIYNDLLSGQGILSEAIKGKARQLVSGVTDPKEKVRKIYEYLQDNTRYISVQLGIGGWQPISASEVDRVKYGDCKGLTNYTMALLKEVGVDSYYTVVYAGASKRSLDPDFPMLSGNHAFLNIPLDGEEIWLECTSQDVPPNFLGTFTDDRYVLKVKPDGGELVKSKQYRPEDSAQLTNATVFIDSEGGVKGEVTIKSTGIQYDNKYDLTERKEDEIEEHYKEYWDYVNNVKITNTHFSNNRDQIEFLESVALTTNSYVSKAGEQWLFAPNMFNRNLYVPKRARDRKTEVVVKRGYLDEDEFVITLPTNMKPEKLLPSINLVTDFGYYHMEMESLDDNKILYKRKLEILPGASRHMPHCSSGWWCRLP
ncbi:MAG: DUF3857 domain-containing protein, partial [Bacteroidota bacterium]